MGSEANISLEATLNTLNNTINNTINDYTAGFTEEGKSCIQDGVIEVGVVSFIRNNVITIWFDH